MAKNPNWSPKSPAGWSGPWAGSKRKAPVRDRLRFPTALWLAAACWLALPSTRAILFVSTADPDYNTTAPAGDLTGSGWDLEGTWGAFLGTPIAPGYFLTARHVGGSIGDSFVFQGLSYLTTAFFDDPDSDLRIWQVAGVFTIYAALYDSGQERGQPLVVFGRGTQRGDPVLLEGKLKGWRWGPSDGRKRWGENQVASIEDGDQLVELGSNNSKIGDLLRATFDFDGGPNEAHLSLGDSGGGVFIRDGSTWNWKLAGINYAVDGPYSTSDSGDGFDAAIFDAGGLSIQENDHWSLIPEKPAAQPGAFYATRVAAHLNWIRSVLSPSSVTPPVLQSAATVQGPYLDEGGALVDPAGRTITLTVPPVTRFYRLSSRVPFHIQSIKLVGQQLILGYQ